MRLREHVRKPAKRICVIMVSALLAAASATAASAAGAAGDDRPIRTAAPLDAKEEGAGAAFKEKPLSPSSKKETAGLSGRGGTRRASGSFTRAAANTSVALFKKAAAANKGQNVLLSPHSILTALSLAENGAAGATRREMEKVFGGISVKNWSESLAGMNHRLAKEEGVDYRIANSVWYRKGSITLKKRYLQNVVGYFGADVYAAPFSSQTVQDINSWVYNNTVGRIPSILDQLSAADRLVLINAIYFNGKWAEPYGTDEKRDFTLASGAKKRVPMLQGTEATYLKLNGGIGFVKPYEGGSIAFVGLLPPEGTSLSRYIQGLSGDAWLKAWKKRSRARVYTRMPEFEYEYSADLGSLLRKLGIRKAFSASADFSGMSDTPTCIDRVLHKTYIRVDKAGTEAAAVTAILMKATAVLDPDRVVKEVYLDRPFVYALVDTATGLPLFLGCVQDPS